MSEATAPARMAYLDNLKALMIIFVVLMHAAVTYSGIGSWYYKEHATLGTGSFYFFLFYELFSQAYFMSLFFMIAAYFVPSSLAKKGAKKFSTGRLFRLGVPTLIYMFFIQALCLKIIHPNLNLLHTYAHGIISLNIIGWTGPMWFAAALLIFSLIYVLIASKLDKFIDKYNFTINTRNISILILIITLIAFAIRLIFPIGTSIYNMQLCFFSAYIFMFLVGIIARKKNLFDTLSYKTARSWFIIAFAIGVPLWAIVVHFGVPVTSNINNYLITGGWNLPAFGYAFWESFFCVAIIVALVGIFKYKFNTQNRLQRFLSQNAFGVYVFHPPILIGTSLLLHNLHLAPVLKFMVVACIAIPLSFIAVSFIRRIKFLGVLFA